MRRSPACAGQFYEGNQERLQQQVAALLDHGESPVQPLAIVCPHAGLMFSGAVAGAVYGRVRMPATAILLGPNHTGYGPSFSLYPDGEWDIPGATIPVASDMARALLQICPLLSADELAHQFEHCLEVQLPFLHAIRPDIRIVPIAVGTRSLESCLALGQALASLIREGTGEAPLLIASTDMTHCGPDFGQLPPPGVTADAFARHQDRLALDALQTLDAAHFHESVERYEVTMCGYAPTTAVLAAAGMLGAHNATIVRYATSSEVSGDVDRVVGYAGIVIA